MEGNIRLTCRTVQPSVMAALCLFGCVWSANVLITSYFFCSSIDKFTFLIIVTSILLWKYYTSLGHFPLWYIRTLSKMVHTHASASGVFVANKIIE